MLKYLANKSVIKRMLTWLSWMETWEAVAIGKYPESKLMRRLEHWVNAAVCLWVSSGTYQARSICCRWHFTNWGDSKPFFSTECEKHIGNNSPAWCKKNLQTFTRVVMGSKVTAASKERGLGASTSAQSSLVVMLKIIREREQKIPPGYCLNAWWFYILSTVCNSSLSSSEMI